MLVLLDATKGFLVFSGFDVVDLVPQQIIACQDDIIFCKLFGCQQSGLNTRIHKHVKSTFHNVFVNFGSPLLQDGIRANYQCCVGFYRSF